MKRANTSLGIFASQLQIKSCLRIGERCGRIIRGNVKDIELRKLIKIIENKQPTGLSLQKHIFHCK